MDADATASISSRVAAHAAALRYESLPAAVADRAKYLLLDYLGCAIRGSLAESSPPVHRLAASAGAGLLPVPIIGTKLSSHSSYAALAMGTAAHAIELDDVVNSASLHPGVAVMSAALAAGCPERCPGPKLLAAVVAGYELCVKLGIALKPAAHYARGFHPTGTCGTFGAALAAAMVMNLTEEQMADAIGIAGSQAAGSLEFLADGAYTKRLHAGWAAHSGIVAALLAAGGFSGPASIIDGKFGFLKSYSLEADPAAVMASWGDPYEVLNTSIKPHACCRYNQGTIDCILELMASHKLRFEVIERVEVAVLEAGWALVAEPEEKKRRPVSVVDAQFSMPFAAALAMLRGDAFLDRYSLAEIEDPQIRAAMDKVVCVRDPLIERDFPRRWPAAVEIVTIDGARYRHRLEYPKGDPENPLDWDELIAKFTRLATAVFSEERCGGIVDQVRQLDTLADIGGLLKLLRCAGD